MEDLDEMQKDLCKVLISVFLLEFQNVSVGNCKVLEHVINVSIKPIKQVPRRILIYMRQEVKTILNGMKRQRIIEKSQSS